MNLNLLHSELVYVYLLNSALQLQFTRIKKYDASSILVSVVVQGKELLSKNKTNKEKNNNNKKRTTIVTAECK